MLLYIKRYGGCEADGHSDISFTTTTYMTQLFFQIQGTQIRRKCTHIPTSQQNMYYINTNHEKSQRNTSVEETHLPQPLLSHKHKKAFCIRFILISII
jgi:hypothetical protein